MPVPFRLSAVNIAPVVWMAEREFDSVYAGTIPPSQAALTAAAAQRSVGPTGVQFIPPPQKPNETGDEYAARAARAKEEFDAANIARENAAQETPAQTPATSETQEPVEGPVKLGSWDDLDDEEQGAVVGDVEHVMNYPSGIGAGLHDRWLTTKAALGWTAGPVYDRDAKTHPFSVPYGDLPDVQKCRYNMIHSLVLALCQSTVVQGGG